MGKAHCSDILSERLYKVDSLTCPECDSEMKILSVIMDTCEKKKILKHPFKDVKTSGQDK